MSELKGLGEVATSVGIPALFFLLFAYALLKLVPEWLKVWKDNKEAEIIRENKAAEDIQKYYGERNKSYTAQLDLMNKHAEQQNQLIGQATQVISRSNVVIEANTKAIAKNTEVHDRVLLSLQSDLEGRREMVRQLQEHDERAQKLYTTALRISDKVDRLAEK